ncbi:hypothetical protein BJ165DRAFT_1401563 [Panaeolus papilionaceus]|nr:hypothetical protein BJ165DRAFT_1401563 [Panaeolus papilionaceus]
MPITTRSGKQPQPVSPPRTNQANKRSLESPNSPKTTRKKSKKKASKSGDDESASAPAPKKKAKSKAKKTRTTADKDAEVAAAPDVAPTGVEAKLLAAKTSIAPPPRSLRSNTKANSVASSTLNLAPAPEIIEPVRIRRSDIQSASSSDESPEIIPSQSKGKEKATVLDIPTIHPSFDLNDQFGRYEEDDEAVIEAHDAADYVDEKHDDDDEDNLGMYVDEEAELDAMSSQMENTLDINQTMSPLTAVIDALLQDHLPALKDRNPLVQVWTRFGNAPCWLSYGILSNIKSPKYHGPSWVIDESSTYMLHVLFQLSPLSTPSSSIPVAASPQVPFSHHSLSIAATSSSSHSGSLHTNTTNKMNSHTKQWITVDLEGLQYVHLFPDLQEWFTNPSPDPSLTTALWKGQKPGFVTLRKFYIEQGLVRDEGTGIRIIQAKLTSLVDTKNRRYEEYQAVLDLEEEEEKKREREKKREEKRKRKEKEKEKEKDKAERRIRERKMMISPTQEFPAITFAAFNQVILENFHADIKLDTVLILLFSILENPEVFNHHSRQKYKKVGTEHLASFNGWISAFSNTLLHRLPNHEKDVFGPNASFGDTGTKMIDCIDNVASAVGFQSYSVKGKKLRTLKPINFQSLQPIHIIAPMSFECETTTCNRYALHRLTASRDLPQVKLLKDGKVIKYAYVIQGKCSHCNTIYAADRETFDHTDNTNQTLKYRTYLNSAQYLKLGQSVWCDHTYSNAVVTGIYSFHASAAAYTQFWNLAFAGSDIKLNRHTLGRLLSKSQFGLLQKILANISQFLITSQLKL